MGELEFFGWCISTKIMSTVVYSLIFCWFSRILFWFRTDLTIREHYLVFYDESSNFGTVSTYLHKNLLHCSLLDLWLNRHILFYYLRSWEQNVKLITLPIMRKLILFHFASSMKESTIWLYYYDQKFRTQGFFFTCNSTHDARRAVCKIWKLAGFGHWTENLLYKNHAFNHKNSIHLHNQKRKRRSVGIS